MTSGDPRPLGVSPAHRPSKPALTWPGQHGRVDPILIGLVLLLAGLSSVVLVLVLGQVLLLLALTATVILDLGATLAAIMVGRPRSHRY